jgi:exocyst complex component 8
LDGVKNAIKLITNDDSKIFQCINSAAKLEWIEKLDSAIKPSSMKAKKAPAPPKPIQTQISTTSDLPSPEHERMSIVEKLAPDWLLSAPEEILAEIAQRHFEDSLALVQKCEDFLAKDQTFQSAADIVEKVKSNNL